GSRSPPACRELARPPINRQQQQRKERKRDCAERRFGGLLIKETPDQQRPDSIHLHPERVIVRDVIGDFREAPGGQEGFWQSEVINQRILACRWRQRRDQCQQGGQRNTADGRILEQVSPRLFLSLVSPGQLP